MYNTNEYECAVQIRTNVQYKWEQMSKWTNEYECGVQIRTNVQYKWEQMYSTNVRWTVFRGT